MRISLYIKLNGIVQGVGMRPFIYRIANELGLSGTVYNSSSGVEIYVTGEEELLDIFLYRIKKEAPPSSQIHQISTKQIELREYHGFSIIKSIDGKNIDTTIPADISLCINCRNELINKDDRRFLYPFINCTDCGPRYSITKKIPYDRSNTTMERFIMCDRCAEEYNDPSNRRFHAQPNACPTCGPSVTLHNNRLDKITQDYDAIKKVKEFIRDGKIIAIKGLGGFHIVCDATNKISINTLRERKKRSMKPFAIMVPDLKTVEKFAKTSDIEKKILLSEKSPILLLEKSEDYSLPEEISYQNTRIGIMLPYTPLHFLLFYDPETNNYDFEALIMTSGNISELPIEFINESAVEKLGDIADFFLLHNRDIFNRVDDSVVYVLEGKEVVLRRARGYVPEPIIIRKPCKESVLATGAELKGCFAITRENQIILSQHLGDLKTEEGIEFFINTYNLITNVLQINPRLAILDKHPLYLTRKIVKKLEIKDIYEVQHHYAHICSVLLENNFEEKVVGFAFDGTGYGDDGAIWGSEVFICDLREYRRIGHLRYAEMAGGDSASELCYIPAISFLTTIGIDYKSIRTFIELRPEDIELVNYSLQKKINLHKSSSMGRLFDAIAFLLGIRARNSFEGEAAMALEFFADKACHEHYPVNLIKNELIEIDYYSLFEQIIEDIKSGVDRSIISAKFHNWIAHAILKISNEIRTNSGINTIALSGGVFQNRYLINSVIGLLKENNFQVLMNRKVPPNDGGISFGQIGHYIYYKSS
ncbi:MAG: carbamoyltransferase HypF [Deltaproteobacteria bacterium]|nr:carbamoyltransferase HypF [Deltaproteobacteria bacterium]